MKHRYILLPLTITLLVLLSILIATTHYHKGERLLNKTVPAREESTTETSSGTSSLDYSRMFKSRDELIEYLTNLLRQDMESVPKGMIQPALTSTREEGSDRYSQTNIQVRGVDEPDIVKTDGRVIAYAYESTVYIIDPFTNSVKSRIKLDSHYRVMGLFLYEDELVILLTNASWLLKGNHIEVAFPGDVGYVSVFTYVLIYDVTRPENPVENYRLSISGNYFGSRLVGKYLYVLTLMDIYYPVIPLINGSEVSIDKISLISLRPTCYLTVSAIDLERFAYSYLSFLADRSSLLYVSTNRIYVGRPLGGSIVEPEILIEISKTIDEKTSVEIAELINRGKINEAYLKIIRYVENLVSNRADNEIEERLKSFTYSDKTVFYVFKYDGLNISFVSKFEVSGIVLDQFAMEELEENFVVATTSRSFRLLIYRVTSLEYTVTSNERTVVKSSEPLLYDYPSITIGLEIDGDTRNNVYVIDVSRGLIIGKLENLAPGERIYSARLVKNVFFLVTYRTIDPLFAIDLTNASNPIVLGFLKIPGFSEYLHPINDNLLIGIGLQDRFDLLKITLFNVTNPSEMSEINSLIINGWSPVLNDHHAVTIDMDYNRIYMPVSNWTTSGVIAIKIVYEDNITLKLEGFLRHAQAIRTIYIDNNVYVIGGNYIKVYDANTLKEIGLIELPTD